MRIEYSITSCIIHSKFTLSAVVTCGCINYLTILSLLLYQGVLVTPIDSQYLFTFTSSLALR